MRHGTFQTALLWTLTALLTLGWAGTALAQDADAILGVWRTAETDKGYSHVKIYRDGDTYSGKIIWLKKPTYGPEEGPELEGKEKTDRQNPDKKLRERPIVGLELLEGFTYDAGDQEWGGGTIYDPEKGKTYKSYMKLDGDTLMVRGYIGFSLLGRTTEWSRVEEKEQKSDD
ncbi:MAG: DUF2147 domain-containing protein [Acidobacteriota bacterium]|nr:DUF2147 domain-containing protein [Acidobacteriota bacterium]